MSHGDAREGKWRGNWRMEWVASTLHTISELVYPALLPLMHTTRLPVFDWTDAPADLNGLVRFGERRYLVSASVPSYFKRSLPLHVRSAARPAITGVNLAIKNLEIYDLRYPGSQCSSVCQFVTTAFKWHGHILLEETVTKTHLLWTTTENIRKWVIYMC